MSLRRRSISSARPPRKVPPKPPAAPQDRRPVDRRASTSQRRLSVASIYVQDMRPHGMVHGRVVRPPRSGSTLESFDEAAAKELPGVIAVVRNGSFLGVIAEREEQAIKAREALIKSAKWKLGPELPDPAKHLRTSEDVAEQGPGDRRQAGHGAAPVPRRWRRPTPSPTRRTPRSARPPRSPNSRDGKIDGVDALARRVPAARRAGEGAEDAGRRDPMRPYRRLGLLRPQRRRRRRGRCGLVGARVHRDGRCVCNGCARTSSPGSPTGRRW